LDGFNVEIVSYNTSPSNYDMLNKVFDNKNLEDS